MDLMPTFLKLAGTELEDRGSSTALDGVDIAPLLFENRRLPDRQPVFWRRGANVAVRRGPWKLVILGSQSPMLFNLKSDPGESRDLASSHLALVKELETLFKDWAIDVDQNHID
jgi:arylsulfatase A-like enzyme